MINKQNAPGDHYPWSATRVVETLWPPAAGTGRWRREHGPQLVCVRYRRSPDGGQRYTTVELMVDHAPVRPKASGRPGYVLKLGAGDAGLVRKLQASGARWDAVAGVWRLSAALARRLQLPERAQRSGAKCLWAEEPSAGHSSET